MSGKDKSWRELPNAMRDAAQVLEHRYDALREELLGAANRDQSTVKKFVSVQSQEKTSKKDPPEYMDDLIILAEELRDVAHRLAELSERVPAAAQTPPAKETS